MESHGNFIYILFCVFLFGVDPYDDDLYTYLFLGEPKFFTLYTLLINFIDDLEFIKNFNELLIFVPLAALMI